jgi:hypothetical protein
MAFGPELVTASADPTVNRLVEQSEPPLDCPT